MLQRDSALYKPYSHFKLFESLEHVLIVIDRICLGSFMSVGSLSVLCFVPPTFRM